MKFLLLPMALLGLVLAAPARAQTNHALPGLNADIVSAAVQPNGKVVVAGAFTGFSGVAEPGIVRLKPDGTLDPAFQLDATVVGTAFNKGNANVALQPDGTVLVFGSNLNVTAALQKNIIRLASNGRVDPTFTAASSLDNQGVGLAVAGTDGTVLVDTGFNRYGGANPASYRLTRLRADGGEDGGFQAVSLRNPSLGFPRGAQLSAVAVQPDGRILLAGNFSTVAGTAHAALARLNADGTVDASFSPAFGLYTLDSSSPLTVSAVFLRADGGIVVSGTFTEVGGVALTGFAALHADGTPDTGFVPDAGLSGASGRVVAVQNDGKILVTQANAPTDSALSLRLVRLNADGSLDAGFASDAVARAIMSGLNNSLDLYAVRALKNGTVVAAGNFSAANALARNAVGLFNADGTVNLGRNQPVVEVAAQTGGFLVTRAAGDKTLAVTVNYKIEGNAGAGTDYAPLSGSARLKAGKAKKAVNVTALTDTSVGKSLKLTLTAGDGYTVGKRKKAKYKLAVGP